MKKKYIARELCAFLWVIATNPLFLIYTRKNVRIENVILNMVGVFVSGGGTSNVIIHLEKMGFIILFIILYTSRWTSFFNMAKYYYFSRISNIEKWCRNQYLKKSLYAAVFTLVLVGSMFFIGTYSCIDPMQVEMMFILCLVLYIWNILILFETITEIIAVKWNESIAVVIVVGLVMVNAVLGTVNVGTKLLFANVLCIGSGDPINMLIKVLYIMGLNIALFIYEAKRVHEFMI